MNAPAHCIRGPSSSPALIVSRSAQSTNARNVPEVAHGREAGLERHPGVAHGQQRVLGAGGRRRRDAGRLDLADEVAVGVDEPGQDGEAGEVDDGRAVGRPSSGAGDRLDACVAHEERRGRGSLAGLDVEQAAGADGEGAGRVGEGGGVRHAAIVVARGARAARGAYDGP